MVRGADTRSCDTSIQLYPKSNDLEVRHKNNVPLKATVATAIAESTATAVAVTVVLVEVDDDVLVEVDDVVLVEVVVDVLDEVVVCHGQIASAPQFAPVQPLPQFSLVHPQAQLSPLQYPVTSLDEVARHRN